MNNEFREAEMTIEQLDQVSGGDMLGMAINAAEKYMNGLFGRLINVPLHDDDSHAKFAIRNARKDLRYYTNMTEQMPVASYLAEQVHQTFVLAETLGFGDRFVPRLITMMMQNAGIKPKPAK